MNAMKPMRFQAALPEHLVALGQEENFAVWRWACLRGTGFPAAMVTQLAASTCASAADQLLMLDILEGPSNRDEALGVCIVDPVTSRTESLVRT